MNNIEKSDFVEAIIDGFKKMRELGYYIEIPIYTVGVPEGSITDPKACRVIETEYVTISRVVKEDQNAIKFHCCEADCDFIVEANTQQQVEEAVTWMLVKNIMPSLNSMKTLLIPAKLIKF